MCGQMFSPPIFTWVSRNTAPPTSAPLPAISIPEAWGVANVVDVMANGYGPTLGVDDGAEDDPFGFCPPLASAPLLRTLILLPSDTTKSRCGLADECAARWEHLEVG